MERYDFFLMTRFGFDDGFSRLITVHFFLNVDQLHRVRSTRSIHRCRLPKQDIYNFRHNDLCSHQSDRNAELGDIYRLVEFK